MSEVRKRIKDRSKKFAFTTELVTDVFAQYFDILHGWGGCMPSEDLGLKHDDNYPILFRYTFPEVIITIRNPKPFMEIKMANFAFTYGFRLESEIRYYEDVLAIKNNKRPELVDYAKKISSLRDRHWELLGEGECIGYKGISCSNPAIKVCGFEAKGKLGYILWNDTMDSQKLSLAMQEKQVRGIDGIAGERGILPSELKSQEVLVVLV